MPSRIAAVAVLASLLLPAAAQADAPCWRPKERESAQVRAFQTMLMVGALHCRARDGSTAEAYNAFVESQQRRLDRHGKRLQRHFRRADRRDARGAYDRYATALANHYSRMFDHDGPCRMVVTMARHAARADGDGLLVLADAYATPPPLTCGPSRDAASETVRRGG